eukprot:g5248.t1
MTNVELVSTLSGHEAEVWCVAWSPEGNRIASVSSDRTVRIWSRPRKDGEKWKCLDILDDAHTRTIRSVSWSPSGTMLATASFDGTVCVYENSEGNGFETVAVLEGHDNEVKCVAWSSSGALLATCGRDKTVWVWETVGLDEADEEDEVEFECISICAEHKQDVKSVAWGLMTNEDGEDAEVLFSASYDDTIKIWFESDDDWECVDTLSGHESTVWGLAVEPVKEEGSSSKRFVSCSGDRKLIIWKLLENSGKKKQWEKVTILDDHASRPIFSVSWSRFTNTIVSGAGDNAMRFVTQKSGANGEEAWCVTCKKEEAHAGDINCVRWCPLLEGNTQLIASCGDDFEVKIWRYSK